MEERDHVFDILNFSDEAVELMSQQNINNLQCFIAILRIIYDGLASTYRQAWKSTGTVQVVLFDQWLSKYASDNDGAQSTDWVQE